MKHLLKRTGVALILCTTVILAGCPADITVGLGEGSALQTLTFSISMGSRDRPVALPFLMVESCRSIYSEGDDVYWLLESDGEPEELRSLRYGEVPAGYREEHAARVLRPDECYAVTYGGSDELYLVADAVGQITVVTQEAAKELVSE